MFDTRDLTRILSAVLAAFLLVAIPPAASAQPFAWSIPSGTETWSTGHVHTILWSGGPAAPINIHLIELPANVIAQTITLNASNDGETAFRLGLLPAGTYQMYIEDTAQTTWAYGPQFQVIESERCLSPCTEAASGAPALVCGQTQAEAESLATALVQSYVSCGMAGEVVPNSIQVETTLLAVGGYPCPSGYSGAYAVEASVLWCCCHQPVPVLPSSWSRLKLGDRHREP